MRRIKKTAPLKKNINEPTPHKNASNIALKRQAQARS